MMADMEAAIAKNSLMKHIRKQKECMKKMRVLRR